MDPMRYEQLRKMGVSINEIKAGMAEIKELLEKLTAPKPTVEVSGSYKKGSK